LSRNVLVTGAAGFIGSHLVDLLLQEGWQVTALDNFDPFYTPALKHDNVARHRDFAGYRLVTADIRDGDALDAELREDYDVVVHLAAKAGVRPSIADPVTYQTVNVLGTQNLLELCRRRRITQFLFASSSSVYGVNPRVPWTEDEVPLPISPYASTKLSGELMGHVYSHLYGIRFLALRFFTVYGPRQRPDLAVRKFAERMLDGEPLPLFGDGESRRDYTFVGDTVRGIRAAMDYTRSAYEVINLGNNYAVSLRDLVSALEDVLGVRARIERLPEQPGDVPQTWADIGKAQRLLGYSPETPLRKGIEQFAAWFAETRRATTLSAP
jgi:UDP-glucuronate 4-epimerase